MQHEEYDGADGIVPVLLVNDEIDAAIHDAGCAPTALLPIERMRSLVADLSMAVANAVAVADDPEFARTVRGLSVLDTAEERDFAAKYLEYLLAEIANQSFAQGLDLAASSDRFAKIKSLVCGAQAKS